MDFVQERQVYIHDQAFSNLKVHFTELSTSSGFWFPTQHQLSVSQSSWYALPESVFMALGSASIFVPAPSLCLQASQTQLLLWLWCTSTSRWRKKAKKKGRIEVTCTLIRTFFIQMCFEMSASVKHWLQARWEQFSSLDFAFKVLSDSECIILPVKSAVTVLHSFVLKLQHE